jgi:hypothetical protein
MQDIARHLNEITGSANTLLDQYRLWDFLWKEDLD